MGGGVMGSHKFWGIAAAICMAMALITAHTQQRD